MRAWQMSAVGEPLQLNEIPDPVAGPDEIVIRIKASGLCHSDVSYLDGSLTHLLPFFPFTLGHEVAGYVDSIGSAVTKFTVGEKVVVPVALDSPGTGIPGGFAEKVLVPERLVATMPEELSWDQAAVATDAGLTSYHGAVVRGGAGPGKKIGVIGFGGLGSLGAQAAMAVGAEVYVAEINEKVWDFARSFGVKKVAKSITEFADDDLDAIIDYAGFGITTKEAIETVRPGIKRIGEPTERPGGRVVQIGLPVRYGEIDLHTLILNEIELVGSQTGTKEDCVEIMTLMADGKVRANNTAITFEEIGEGIKALERGEVTGRLVALLD